jgi:hypothetical protein
MVASIKVFAAVYLSIHLFWNMTLFHWVALFRRFGENVVSSFSMVYVS